MVRLHRCLLLPGLLASLLTATPAFAADAPDGSRTIRLPAVVKWMLQGSTPCPNCDAVQTWVGRKPTPLPSPLPAGSGRQVRSAATLEPASPDAANPLDSVSWVQWRALLPAGLRMDDGRQKPEDRK